MSLCSGWMPYPPRTLAHIYPGQMRRMTLVSRWLNGDHCRNGSAWRRSDRVRPANVKWALAGRLIAGSGVAVAFVSALWVPLGVAVAFVGWFVLAWATPLENPLRRR